MDLKQRLALLKPRTAHSEPAFASGHTDGESCDPLASLTGDVDVSDQHFTEPAIPIAQRIVRQRGTHELPMAVCSDQDLCARLGGTLLVTGLIECERVLALPTTHGEFILAPHAEFRLPYLGVDQVVNATDVLFLDTETTGLAGGTGTLPFLVGMARIEGAALRVRQLFLTGFRAETALLDRLSEWATPNARIVSFNGKAFDVPLLTARYRLARKTDPLAGLDHIDLLHPTRNAFARRWEDCRLQTAETRLFGLQRDDDLPGHLIPYAWFNFVRSRAPGEVPRILEHNEWDVRSLAALLVALARVYDDPVQTAADTLGVARTHRRRGAPGEALRLLAADAERLGERGLLELAAMHRRNRQWDKAVALWQRLDAAGCLAATESLAKYFEHEAHDALTALGYAERLLAHDAWNEAHCLRHARLMRKSGRMNA
jgi:uncharacterized protein YprB with RNaseH-like and TPR domain